MNHHATDIRQLTVAEDDRQSTRYRSQAGDILIHVILACVLYLVECTVHQQVLEYAHEQLAERRRIAFAKKDSVEW